MLLTFLRLWLGPLPVQEIFPEKKPNPFLHWFVHPVKRRLAKLYLWLLGHFTGLKVIAVTGSTGKTTTKKILCAILSPSGTTVATADNTTSTYNIPTTILTTPPGTKYLVLEMSVEYPGDMDFYTWLARPDVAVFLNVAPVHTVYFKDLDSIAAEKSKIFSRLPPEGSAVINSDDPRIFPPINAKTYSFGSSSAALCQIISAKLTKNLTTEIKLIINQQPMTYNLPLIGEHFAQNLAAALAAASALGIPPPSSVAVSPVPRRMNPVKLPSGSVLIDDTHNANPVAVSQSLQTLVKLTKLLKKTPVFVFAQMNELGSFEKSAHQDVGKLIKKIGIKHLYCLGPAAKFTLNSAGTGRHFPNQEKLQYALQKLINHKSSFIILVKGSRSWHLEDLVVKISRPQPPAPAPMQ